MKCLVVSSHPLSESLCMRLTRRVVRMLDELGHEVILEDLYVQNFQPSLMKQERRTYYQHPYDSSAVDDYVNRLLDAEVVILVFPTWWFGFPAILKGWFDRVWGPGIAYDHASDYGPIKPRLNRLAMVMAITTLGAPRWVDILVMRQPVKRILKVALLGACARKSGFKYLALYKSEKLTEKRISQFEKKIDFALAGLNHT